MPKGQPDSVTLVSNALRILGIDIEIEGGEIKIRQIPPLRAYAVNECLVYLSSNTGPDLAIDPFKEAEGTAWISVSHILSQLGLKFIAVQISQRYVQLCYSLQDRQERRMHKGAPLFWLAIRYLEAGERDSALSYMMLAFIEDIAIQSEPTRAPAYQQLVAALGVSPSILEGLIEYVRISVVNNFPFFPEDILIRFQLEKLPTFSKKYEAS